MDDFAEQVLMLNPTQFAELFGNLSDLVYDMYDRLKNGIIYYIRDVNVYITDDIERTVYIESNLDDPNTRTDYFDMYIHPENIEDISHLIQIEPGVYEYHFTETITNQLNRFDDIVRAKHMLSNIQLQYIINPQMRHMNNNHSLYTNIRRKLALVDANEIDDDRLIDQDALRNENEQRAEYWW